MKEERISTQGTTLKKYQKPSVKRVKLNHEMAVLEECKDFVTGALAVFCCSQPTCTSCTT